MALSEQILQSKPSISTRHLQCFDCLAENNSCVFLHIHIMCIGAFIDIMHMYI